MSSSTPASQTLQTLRQRGGMATSAELQVALGISQPTVSRTLAPLLRSGQVRKVGAARSQGYVLPRHLAGVGCTVLIVRVNTSGLPSAFARMVLLEGDGICTDEEDGLNMRHHGLPWFLQDMRPQGFMGCTFAHAYPELQLGSDPSRWSDDNMLRAMVLFGDDLPGNLIVGGAAFQCFQSLTDRAFHASSATDYPRLAERAMQGALGASSAGGEQPKFCTITAGRPVLVKFSPPGESPAAQRLRDLLVCEHLAIQTLAKAGWPAANTQLFMDGGRVFLESERFDRTPQGRIGMVSLAVYDAEYVGQKENWAATADRMAARGLLTPEDARRMRFLEAYGVLIANTDRHYGNISLLLHGTKNGGDWALSSTYDMLPMLYAPINGAPLLRTH